MASVPAAADSLNIILLELRGLRLKLDTQARLTEARLDSVEAAVRSAQTGISHIKSRIETMNHVTKRPRVDVNPSSNPKVGQKGSQDAASKNQLLTLPSGVIADGKAVHFADASLDTEDVISSEAQNNSRSEVNVGGRQTTAERLAGDCLTKQGFLANYDSSGSFLGGFFVCSDSKPRDDEILRAEVDMDGAIDLNKASGLWAVLHHSNWKEQNFGVFSTESLARQRRDEVENQTGTNCLIIVKVLSQERARTLVAEHLAKCAESDKDAS